MGRVQTGDDVKSLILRPSELRELVGVVFWMMQPSCLSKG